MSNRALDAMRRAQGAWYRGRRVADFGDDELVAEIDRCRREGIEKFVNKYLDQWNWAEVEAEYYLADGRPHCIFTAMNDAVRKLTQESPESPGDAAARIFDHEYAGLWNEALERGDRVWPRVRADGGWGL